MKFLDHMKRLANAELSRNQKFSPDNEILVTIHLEDLRALTADWERLDRFARVQHKWDTPAAYPAEHTPQFKVLKHVDELKICSEWLEKLRFAGLDQNPHGIRDLLYSSVSSIERIAKDRG